MDEAATLGSAGVTFQIVYAWGKVSYFQTNVCYEDDRGLIMIHVFFCFSSVVMISPNNALKSVENWVKSNGVTWFDESSNGFFCCGRLL